MRLQHIKSANDMQYLDRRFQFQYLQMYLCH